ncbi:hypothetical protein RHGRI_023599 [Rhododendron griersonianum]|uniref:Uncharacterized protein n=1 Tax=Rhododendron griersonianum TaxID=479676 RepID=A0AAV6J5V6_9ERIC|nr:hypothetical protein RHGRI_023599 [Rhododendron griersonianum]
MDEEESFLSDERQLNNRHSRDPRTTVYMDDLREGADNIPPLTEQQPRSSQDVRLNDDDDDDDDDMDFVYD